MSKGAERRSVVPQQATETGINPVRVAVASGVNRLIETKKVAEGTEHHEVVLVDFMKMLVTTPGAIDELRRVVPKEKRTA